MRYLLTFFSNRPFIMVDDKCTVYVPLSAKGTASDALSKAIHDWFNPELRTVVAYHELEQANQAQQPVQGCNRFPNTEIWHVIIELECPNSLVSLQQDGSVKVDLRYGTDLLHVSNAYITAKYLPGDPCEPLVEGDRPHNGIDVYEVIPLAGEENSSRPLFTFK